MRKTESQRDWLGASEKSTLKSGKIPKKIKVFVIDDYPVVRQGIAKHFEKHLRFVFCGSCTSSENVLEELHGFSPQIVIAEPSKISGDLELIKNIRIHFPEVLILIFSICEEAAYAERCLAVGAHGYVIKKESPEKLDLALESLLKGDVYLSAQLTSQLISGRYGKQETPHSLMSNLTDREQQILKLLGKGYNTREIASQLNRGIKTIDSYRYNLKKKLNFKNSIQLIRFAVQLTLGELTESFLQPTHSSNALS